MRCSTALALAVALASGLPGLAVAAEHVQPAAPPEETNDVDWRFPTVHPAEMIVSGVLLGGGIALHFAVPRESEPRWNSGILFDQAVAEASFVTDPDTHRAWTLAGDVPWIASLVWSGGDPLISGIAYDWDVAVQMAMMNAEAFSVLTAVLWGTQYFVPRERPLNTRLCSDADRAAHRELDDYGSICGTENGVRSFIGGHVAVTAASTTLTCFHHAYLPLYGGGVGDAVPCAMGIVGTGLVFAARTITNTHYFSDNALGLGVGVLSAMVPWGLHYARGSTPEPAKARSAGQPGIGFVAPMAMPAADGRGGMVGVSGALF